MTACARICLLAVALILPVASGTAGPVPTGPTLTDAGWALWTRMGVPAARFERQGDGAIEIAADSGFALLYRRIADEETGARILRWRWRVDVSTPPTDLSRRGADDRPLAVHVWFPDEEASFFRRIGQGLAGSLRGIPLRGKVLTYVWGGIDHRGDQIPNPYLDADGVIITLRPANTATGLWYAERVDLAADFERAFGHAPPKPSHLAISADSDDAGGHSVGIIADLTLAD